MKAACLLTDSMYSLAVSDSGGVGAGNGTLGCGFASVGAVVGEDQGCLTRRTWRFGRRFRTRTDGHTCPSIPFRRTSACKKFFTNFSFFTMGNFSEADVSNLDPCWRRASADRCVRA